MDQVQDLIDSANLSKRTGNSLQLKLETAIKKFDQGSENTAINQLQAFIIIFLLKK